MVAHINSKEFIFKEDFVQSTSGQPYDYKNFDFYQSGTAEVNKTNNPDVVGGKTGPGTLGRYYNTNNSWEPYTPAADYPYTREIYYRDGTGDIKKSAGPGEALKSGCGHETASFITPVGNELDHYNSVRNKFFTSAELGEEPSSMSRQAIQKIIKDPINRKDTVIADKGETR